jgi:hypothetical protein
MISKDDFEGLVVDQQQTVPSGEDFGFRPLTEEEKLEFVNSLNAEGKRLLQGLDREKNRPRAKRSRRFSSLTPSHHVVQTERASANRDNVNVSSSSTRKEYII